MLVKFALSLGALAIGASFAFQVSINAGLARALGSGLGAALMSFLVGTVTLVAVAIASGQLSFTGALRTTPLWMMVTGGMLGAFIVYGSILLAPRIGVAALAVFIIAGQLLVASIIDHFGLFGVPVHEINWLRVGGIVMLFAGALLVRLN